MSTSLLTTKLYIPPVRPELISRPRLIERLNSGLHRKLTLISAPAGFGKTTLISQWLHSSGRPFTWLSLDEGDNNPARFMAYLIAALQKIDRRIGQHVLSPSDAPRLMSHIEPLVTGLINDIALSPVSFVVVLDDYHAIHLGWIHRLLEFLITHQPPHMHLAFGTRSDPPLPLPRLRARGQMTEIRAEDLRFTMEEAADLLGRVPGLALEAKEAAALAARTEGWIAGLQLAVLSMRNEADVTGFVSDFSGSHRHVVDYLAEEVIAHQPDCIQDFLSHTAILERLIAPLCDAVTGRQDSQAVLRQLEQDNLFLTALDDRREWYRYHGLFAEFLHNHLRQHHAGQIPKLHRRAADWYEQNGFPAEAVGHALAARDWTRAARLIEEAVESTFSRGEVTTLLHWMEALPDAAIRARPRLSAFYAWALLLTGRPLDVVESRLQSTNIDDGLVAGRVAALRALVAAFQAQFSHVAELSQEALRQLPDDDLFLRSIVAINSAIPAMWTGDVVLARRAWTEVARIGRQAGNLPVTVVAMCQHAEQYMIGGELQEAAAIYQRALEMASDDLGHRLPLAGMALIGLGELSREWDELDRATRHLTEGVELIRQWLEAGAIDGYVSMARVRQAQGDAEGALASIREAQRLARRFDATELDDLFVAVHQVRLQIVQGDVDVAERCVKEYGFRASVLALGPEVEGEEHSTFAYSYHLWELAGIALARFRIAQQQPASALELLEVVRQRAETRHRVSSVIEALVLQALAHQTQSSLANAMACLQHALCLAQSGGYIRIFVDEGPSVAELLRQLAAQRSVADHGIDWEYVDRLLAALTPMGGTSEPAEAVLSRPRSQPLIEPLTDRELEVLRLLPTILSTPGMADQLFISVNTVRSHIKNIYAKLNVHSRMEAIQRAEELGLL